MKKTTGMDRAATANWRPATKALRGGTWRSEHGETSEALFLTSGYTYDDAQTVADRFAGTAQGMTYSRLQNPTVAMLEERIALMEGAEACRAQASGMAAMTAALLCQLSAGDHVVAARAAFGSCRWLTDTLLPKFGIETTLVDSAENAAWEPAIRPNTKVFFFETPANPTLDVVDLEYVCGLARAHGITTVVDNAFASPVLQRPMAFGADVVAYSATKLMDGQGRVLAGAICGSKQWIDEVLMPFQRNTGPTLSAFNAWVVLKGLETLPLRAFKQSEQAVALGEFLEPRVTAAGGHLRHPGLPSHPRHELAKAQMDATGIGCGHAGAGLRDSRRAETGRYIEQYRRCPQPDVPSGLQHPRQHGGRGARGDGCDRRPAADQRGAGRHCRSGRGYGSGPRRCGDVRSAYDGQPR